MSGRFRRRIRREGYWLANRARAFTLRALRGSNLVLILAGVLVGLVTAELLGQAYFRVRTGAFLGDSVDELASFQVRPFTTLVEDPRMVTLKKRFRFENIETDQNGFRVGAHVYLGRRRIVVFIGDSVPFGWGVPGQATVPSHFARLLEHGGQRDSGVLNAAIPSYALRQAIERYVREVDGRYPVSAVVLQVFDPVSQLVLHGKDWQPDMNWTTHDAELTLPDKLLFQGQSWVRHSSLLYYGSRARYALGAGHMELSASDTATQHRFMQTIQRDLRRLGDRLAAHGIPLYLLAANPTAGVPVNGRPFESAVRWLNDAFREYAKGAAHTHFVDLVARFDDVGRKGMFIDDHCHLTDGGAEFEARTVYEAMTRNGDL